ncbi:hypothetical protein M885DRAFT_506698 [Pelagophyceae sp. CCMP2097]|nr:hypothetical protein M885DRAFT_506698 [Pelagophyceae sp. CCMP2097]|mmetsp:Transcript_11268/g.39118  ORF Transcript_11268/g.39118 Transcript_11268/m.39118 type:complete len:254 (+) Transcript_11268:79-840(+)
MRRQAPSSLAEADVPRRLCVAAPSPLAGARGRRTVSRAASPGGPERRYAPSAPRGGSGARPCVVARRVRGAARLKGGEAVLERPDEQQFGDTVVAHTAVASRASPAPRAIMSSGPEIVVSRKCASILPGRYRVETHRGSPARTTWPCASSRRFGGTPSRAEQGGRRPRTRSARYGTLPPRGRGKKCPPLPRRRRSRRPRASGTGISGRQSSARPRTGRRARRPRGKIRRWPGAGASRRRRGAGARGCAAAPRA